MEIVAAVSSVVALLQLIEIISKTVHALTKHYSARNVFGNISKHTSLLSAELIYLKSLENLIADNAPLLSEDESASIERVLKIAHLDISNASKFCLKHQDLEESKKKRLAWILRDAHRWDELATHLQHTEIKLARIVATMQLKIATRTHADIKSIIGLISEAKPVLSRKTVDDEPYNPLNRKDEPFAFIQTYMDDTSFGGTTRIPRSWWEKYGIHFTVIMAQRSFSTSYLLTLRARIPTFTQTVAFALKLSMRISQVDYPSITPGFSWRRIISDSSAAVQACKNQDLETVRRAFTKGDVMPNDMTSDFRPLLWHAIKGGSIEIVQYLLLLGADATVLSGRSDAGILHIAFYFRRGDIARLLMGKGADVEQLNAEGSAPIFHLFQPDRIQRSNKSIEFLQMLAACAFSGFNTHTAKGWTPLHRAAAYGSREDVRFLISCGVSTTSVTNDTKQSPIFVAVDCNNTEAFQELLPYSMPDFVHAVDAKGWTILHAAAQFSEPDIVASVIKHGADFHALSERDNPLVPEAIRDCRLTPHDVAKHYGLNIFKKYILGLQNAGVRFDYDDDEIYWSFEVPSS